MLWDRCKTSKLRLLSRFSPTVASGILYLALLTSLSAQERVRTAAEPLAIQAFARSPDAFFYLGPFQEVLTGTAGVQYTDNVNLTPANKISDLSYSQGLSLDTTWVISHLNQLQFTFGGLMTENFYGDGKSKLTFAIDPNSKIEFKFEVGDFKVRLYDQFSYTQNPTTDPTATDTANLNSVTNTLGAVIDANLNVAILSLSADYGYNSQSGTNAQGQANATTTGTRESFRVGPALTFRLSPEVLYGVNAVATRSTGIHAANVNSLNVGPFLNGKLSHSLDIDLAAGGTFVDTKPSISPSYFYSIALRYKAGRHLQVLFSGSHELIFTTATNLTEQNLFKVGTQFDITRAISFTLSPFVNFGDVKTTNQGVVNANTSEGNYTLFGLEVGLDWKFRKRWSSSLTYNYVRRESGATFGTGTPASNNYIQNTLAFSLSYAF
jgi:hypothetical protein